MDSANGGKKILSLILLIGGIALLGASLVMDGMGGGALYPHRGAILIAGIVAFFVGLYLFPTLTLMEGIVVSGEERTGSRSIFTPAAVDEYGSVTSRAVIDVPRGCCFTVAVESVNGTVNDPATTPTPLINVIDGSLSIKRTA